MIQTTPSRILPAKKVIFSKESPAVREIPTVSDISTLPPSNETESQESVYPLNSSREKALIDFFIYAANQKDESLINKSVASLRSNGLEIDYVMSRLTEYHDSV